MPKVRDCAAGPHAVLVRAGGAAQPRPHRPRLLARGEDDAQQAQAGHQVPPEEGRKGSVSWVGGSVVRLALGSQIESIHVKTFYKSY